VGVFGDQGLQESGEARVGVRSVGLAEHFTEHVKNPGTLGVEKLVVGVGRFRRGEACAHDEGADIGGRKIFVGGFGDEAFAIAIEPEMERLVGIFLGVGEEEGEVAGNGFVNPLIAIAGPADDVAPPLMSDFVKRNNLGIEFLVGGVEAGAALDVGREKRKGGEVEKAGPALSESAGNLRNAEAAKGKGSGKLFVEMDRGIDGAGELFEGVGRAGGVGRGFDGSGAGIVRGVRGKGRELLCGGGKAREDGFFELTIGVDVHGTVFGGDGGDGVFAEIETGLGDGLIGGPFGGAVFAIVAFVALVAGGDEAQMFGPTQN